METDWYEIRLRKQLNAGRDWSEAVFIMAEALLLEAKAWVHAEDIRSIPPEKQEVKRYDALVMRTMRRMDIKWRRIMGRFDDGNSGWDQAFRVCVTQVWPKVAKELDWIGARM